MGITDYSATAASNTTINGVNIDEGCNPAGINNAIREVMADIAAYDLPQLFTNTNAAIALKANIANPTFTGTATAPKIRLTNTADVSLTSTEHAFQIGNTSGAHLKIDGNELQSQANATTAGTLVINAGGGSIGLGATGAAIVTNGNLSVVGNVTFNQTWQNVAGSRSSGVSYQNTTGKNIQVAMVAFNAGSTTPVQVSSNGSTWITVGLLADFDNTNVSFEVPPSWFYRIQGAFASISSWAELR